jgi:phosphoenolpyruvate carboxykinase (ATP)
MPRWGLACGQGVLARQRTRCTVDRGRVQGLRDPIHNIGKISPHGWPSLCLCHRMTHTLSLEALGIQATNVLRNASPPELYELALREEEGTQIASSGALVALSGEKTGRSPADKRIVEDEQTRDNIWWGPVNIKLKHHAFDINRERAQDYLNIQKRLYVVDGYAGWRPEHRLKVRVVCARAYHALFMHNMLIRPTQDELRNFGEPDFSILNAGGFPANHFTGGMTSKTSVDLSFQDRQLVILGTEYAGEMKKGVFTVMNYLMPAANLLSMHCSATESIDGSNSSIFFGLSGTGKTTLSADPKRRLIGDDEHCWDEQGIFNIEGGCYAKAIDLTEENEPNIYRALRFGAVLENVVLRPGTREVDFGDTSITKNTRGSYPIEYMDGAKVPCTAGHPKNVILLTCDAFGVLPPVSKLTPAQAMYHFISGYTAKVAGTEMGVTDPEATFSPCYGGPFLVWHPNKYAELLARRLREHASQAWLVNTGWSGGSFGRGARIKLKYTRAIVDAIHSGELMKAPTERDPVFGLEVPVSCPGVPERMMQPRHTWESETEYKAMAKRLANLFRENFKPLEGEVTHDVKAAGPSL